MARHYALLAFILVATVLFTSMLPHAGDVAAAPAAASSAGGAPPGPPPEAIDACKGKAEGAQVSFSGHHGEAFTGVCQLVNGVLAARPAGGAGGPPPR